MSTRGLSWTPEGQPRAALWGIAAVLEAALAGALVALGYGPLLLALAVVAAAIGLALQDWRRSITWLLLYLPVSGLLPLLLYPDTGPGVLLKDVLFLVPAYLAFLVAVLRGRERLLVPGLPVGLLLALSLLVVAGAFNPRVTNATVALIGMRGWLYYLLLIPVGYAFARSAGDVQRLLKRMTIVAMLPCTIGIAEAVLVYNGHAATVYALYGDAAAASTQDFVRFDFGLVRIPSIFTFISQYWLFSTATVAVAYAAWRGNRSDPLMAWLGPVAMGVAALASFTSGARAAFIFTPFLLVLIAGLEGVRIGRLARILGFSAAGILVALSVLGIGAGPLANSTSQHTGFILDFFGQGIRFALDESLLGLGTGMDTNQARYAFAVTDPTIVFRDLGGVWYESWYLKAIIELGVPGLVVLVGLVLALLRRCWTCHRELRDPELRAMSAAFMALFIWTAIYAVKTAYVDFDPLNTYVWLFIGIQWRLRTLRSG